MYPIFMPTRGGHGHVKLIKAIHQPGGNHHVNTCNPSPRCVRFVKYLILFLPTMSFLMCIVVLGSRSRNPTRKSPTAGLVTLETVVERDHLCENWGEENVTTPNATVVSICRKLNITAKHYYRLQANKVNPFRHKFIISSPHICDNRTEIVVLIHSLHDHLLRRRGVRETWGGAVHRRKWPRNVITANIRVAFIFGLHRNRTWNSILQRESEHYGDVIQGDFLEDYHNMTLKSQLGLKWVAQECAGAKYFIKSDDDMIINFPELLRILGSTRMGRSIMGPLNPVSKVSRSGKWGIEREKFPFYYFPPYESGSAYVISGDLVRPLYEASEFVPPIFIDDVYITGILGRILGVRHIHQDGFAYWTNKKPHPCDILTNKILTGTRLHHPKDLFRLWDSIVHGVDCSRTPGLAAWMGV